jgi:hypothetical protein
MIQPHEFWRRVGERTGPGVLVLVLLESWKRVADEIGMDAIDMASAVFDALCELASAGADAQARLTTTVFGAYWSTLGADETAAERLTQWLPLTIISPGTSIPVECRWIAVARGAAQTGRDLYLAGQADLERLVAGLPPSERYPPMPRTWEELMGQ